MVAPQHNGSDETSNAQRSVPENSKQSNGSAGANDKAPGKGKGKNKGSSPALDPAIIEAKRKARAEKKEREEQERVRKEEEAASGSAPIAVDAHGRPLYRPREWAAVNAVDGVEQQHGQLLQSRSCRPRIKVLSWNMLAQGLVRRKLFPGSDAMRWKDREAGLSAELLGHGFDVACLQEVDRVETHTATLSKAGYSHLYAKGYAQKQHGLMLAWRSSSRRQGAKPPLFEEKPAASRIVYLDDEEVAPGRTGCSRVTRNIGIVAALPFVKEDAQPAADPGGIILATAHLFWHPMHGYERLRQAGLLVRAIDRFRRSSQGDDTYVQAWADWPVIFAGDFNDQPHSASYACLTGRLPIDEHGREEIRQSSVVHKSVDEKRERERQTGAAALQEEKQGQAASTCEEQESDALDEAEAEDAEGEGEEEEEGADDQILKNCRPATPSDGLLRLEELEALFDLSSCSVSSSTPPRHLRSAYGSSFPQLCGQDEDDNLFSTPTRGRERWDDPDWKEGDPNVHTWLAGTQAGCEPMWTLFSSLFSLTLDFILLFPRTKSEGKEGVGYPKVTKLLRTHRTEVLKEGLPRKGICVSDHVAIGAELEL